jgi:phospholipase/carboxylesterase
MPKAGGLTWPSADALNAGMSGTSDQEALLDATTALVPPLLTALDALAWAGRHLHPPDLDGLAAGMERFREPLADGLRTFDAVSWPEHLHRFRDHVRGASAEALAALDGIIGCGAQRDPVLGAFKALAHQPRALAELYPVAFMLPPVGRYFVSEPHRQDAALLDRLAAAEPGREGTGILHAANLPTERGGFSLYVPEYYEPGLRYPLVVALHGGSGHGRSFLWTWLRDARTRGAILLSPSSLDATWSLMSPEQDCANLTAMVAHVHEGWSVDESRVLLTGMSDGGTFSYLAGLRDDSPFTHIAPMAASFHPLLLEGCSAARLQDLPVYLVHGALDWMFPVDVARTARDALSAAGARVTYREIADLSHTYPREENDRLLDWLLAAP